MQRLVSNSIVAVALAAQASAVNADPEVQALAIATGVLVAYAIATPDEQESSHLAFEVGRFGLALAQLDPADLAGARCEHLPRAQWVTCLS